LDSRDLGEVFSVTLQKVGDARLGLDIDYVPEREAMPVRAITGHLVEQWNQEHPESQVKAGDRIVEVNGARGTAALMMKALKESEYVNITLVRIRKTQSHSKCVDDWEYVRIFQDHLDIEDDVPLALAELVSPEKVGSKLKGRSDLLAARVR